ncbi:MULTISPECIES: restriction endonuclease subunit S [unclassified Pseudomonas]|uniref:restriction endonuclease subunit S n=1 Tax=unclassified Pseudomonas TaxID=196821 RepID=UPI001EE2CC76|nr:MULTISPECIES: restriction endonuclease subunit S [unclassified Pseudomonas]
MSSEWRKMTFGDFVAIQRGHDLPDQDRKSGSVPILGSFGITGYHDTVKAKGPGVTIGRSGASFGVAAYSDQDYWPLNTALYVTDFKGNHPKFVFYFMKAFDFSGFNSGSAQPSLNRNNLYPVAIRVPLPSEQRAMAEMLGALDDRITLLRETNATLEAIAQVLFKSWFVNFDPVRAKAEGLEPEGMDAATAALFPDSLEESELGLVPKGWATRPIYDMASYINGAAYKAFEPNAERRGLPIIKIAELKAGVTSQTAFSDIVMPDKYVIKTGDILFSWSGNPDTSIDTFVWGHDPALLNQHIFRVLPHIPSERSFVLQTLRNLKPVFAELARNKQTTGLGHVTVADLKRLHVVNPPASVIEQFNNFAETIHQMIFGNEQQAQTLAQLRDTLLPRLISGQLRLPESKASIENMLSEAV